MSQLSKILAQAATASSPEEQADILLDAVRDIGAFGAGNMQDIATLFTKAQKLCQQIQYPLGLARCIQLDGQLAFFRMDYETAFKNTRKALGLFEEIGSVFFQGETLMGMSMATWDTGNYSEGLDMAFRALQLAEQANATELGGIVSYMLGSFYFDLKDYKNAHKYFSQGYDLAVEANTRQQSIGRCIIGLGSVALMSGQYEEATNYFYRAIDIQLEINDKAGLGRSYNDLGKVHFRLKQYEKADELFAKSMAIRKKLGNHTGLITTLMDCAEMYVAVDRLEEALPLLMRSLELSEKLNTKAKRYRTYQLLGKLYQKKGLWEKALHYFNDFYQLKEEVQGEDFSFEIRKLEKRMELEKKEKESEIYRLRNVELKDAYQRIEKKNRDITASINYAKRIQDAMLHDMSGLKAYVKDYFVFFKPRDIVSGDFYWFTEKDGKAYVASVDCTGHGVPGAFMSMIGNNLLDQAVHLKDLHCPAEILTYLHQEIQRSLRQADGENNDGMDMVLCVIDRQQEVIEFAGAKNPLLFVQENELFVVKGNKMPIGGTSHLRHKGEFTKHILPLMPNNCYYLLSDGFQDQFGHGNAGKFKQKRLRELLTKHHHRPMEEQKLVLEQTLSEWMGNEKQIDDILVLGLAF